MDLSPDEVVREELPLLRQFQWLDPFTAINFAYALHAADDPASLKTPYEGELARQLARQFNELVAEPDTPDGNYLTQVRLVVLSHAKGITRRKNWMIEQQADALKTYQEQLGQLQGSRGVNAWLNVLYTKGGMMVFATLFMGAIGYLLAQTIGVVFVDSLPEEAKTGKPISALASLFFAGIGKIASAKWSDMSQNRIVQTYEKRKHNAKLAYERGKLEEIRIHIEKLKFLWKQFMGYEYPERASYALVIATDLQTELESQRERQEENRSLVYVIIQQCRQKIWRRKVLTQTDVVIMEERTTCTT